EVRNDGPEVGRGGGGARVREPARVAARERVVEATFYLEGGGRAFEALRCESGRPHSAPRSLRLGEVRVARARALPLDEAPREARGEGDGVHGPCRVESQQLRRGGGAAEYAVDRARAKTVRRSGREESPAATALDLVARGESRQELLPGPPFSFGRRDPGRNHQHAGVRQHAVGIGAVVRCDGDPVGEDRAHAGGAGTVDPQRRALAGAD